MKKVQRISCDLGEWMWSPGLDMVQEKGSGPEDSCGPEELLWSSGILWSRGLDVVQQNLALRRCSDFLHFFKSNSFLHF
jgi:hypothetical protein